LIKLNIGQIGELKGDNCMRPYLNINGDSNVEEYDPGTDYIDVKFKGAAKVYRYFYISAGQENVEQMKILAQRGTGLNSFIRRNVRTNYVR
jgi:hypothetical protein